MVWIAHHGKAKLPRFLSLGCQRLWLARYAIEFTSRLANFVENACLDEASQLEATGWSPEAPIKEQYNEFFVCQSIVDPGRSHTFGWVEQRRDAISYLVQKAESEVISLRPDHHLFTGTNVPGTQHHSDFKSLTRLRRQRSFDVHQPS